MKIRTDFVTNSSSSSYCVQILAEDKSGELYAETFGLSGPSYGFDPQSNILCPAERIAAANSLAELHMLLGDKSVDIGKRKLSDYFKKIEKKMGDIKQLRRLTLKRFLLSWGECSGDTVSCDGTLLDLACEVVNASKKEKDAALNRFTDYLNNAVVVARRDDFPSDFCGNNSVQAHYDWSAYADNVEKLAKKIKEIPHRKTVQSKHKSVIIKTWISR